MNNLYQTLFNFEHLNYVYLSCVCVEVGHVGGIGG